MTDKNTTPAAVDDSVYRDALETLILTATIAKEARQETEQRLKGFGVEVTGPQYRLLRQLQRTGHAMIKELSQSMLVEPATLVPMVDSLERRGLIRRGVDPRDRRRTPLELTDVGRERLGHAPFIHEDDPIARYLRGLADDERQTFLRHLRGLASALHGHDEGVRHITDAVNAYFDYGQTIERPQPGGAHPQPPTQKETPSEEAPS